MFPESLLDKEAVWLLGIYVKLVWDNVICKKNNMNKTMVENECFLQFSDYPDLAHIIGLLQ